MGGLEMCEAGVVFGLFHCYLDSMLVYDFLMARWYAHITSEFTFLDDFCDDLVHT